MPEQEEIEISQQAAVDEQPAAAAESAAIPRQAAAPPEFAPVEQPGAAEQPASAEQPDAAIPQQPEVPQEPGAVAFQAPAWGAGAGFPLLPVLEPKPKRPVPWRWIGAVLTAAAVGAGCAFGVMAPRRTEVPGLRTASDGRYVFAPLSLPTLAAGQAVPSADAAGQHLADIRKLLLTAPQGAVSDHALTLADGWLSKADSLKLTSASSAALDFGQYGWRHTAAESWKTTDGAETKIYLLQFSSEGNASTAETTLAAMTGMPGDAVTTTIAVDDQVVTYDKVAHGSTNTWYGIASVRDTVLEIVYTAPSSVGLAPFQQELTLQTELLE